jgi:hypothetical protein
LGSVKTSPELSERASIINAARGKGIKNMTYGDVRK